MGDCRKMIKALAISVLVIINANAYTQEDIEGRKDFHEKYLKNKITPSVIDQANKANIPIDKMKDFKNIDMAQPDNGSNIDIRKIETEARNIRKNAQSEAIKESILRL